MSRKTQTRMFVRVVVPFSCVTAVLLAAAVTHGRHAAQHPCRGTAMPRSVCSALRRAAIDEGLPVAWSYSPALARIIKDESGFDRCAVEPSRHSCNYTGSHACGWFQLNPCRCYRSAVTQARCGLLYIKERYGSPDAALSFRRGHGWY